MPMHLRVLLIEDSEDDAALVVRELTRGGFRVDSERVDTPEALAAALDTRTWDLAIADFSMPRFSGTAALKLLRERAVDLPFIFVSGTIGEDAAVSAMKTGAHDYIMKGNLKRLVPAVEREMRDASVRHERRRADERLAHMAYHDTLTDLPNRLLLYDRLEQAAHTAHLENKPMMLLVMDLDGFKDINDTLGHQAGDLVLQQVAARLRDISRDADTVARLGGDEFAMVLPLTDRGGAVLAAGRVLQVLERPFVIDDRAMTVRGSIGIACFPDHGSSADALLQRADVAMYLAKADACGYVIYSPDRDRHTHRRLALTTQLGQGLDRGEFFLEYQPILHLATASVVGVEALVRWQHPGEGRLLPADFVDLAEQTGQINALTTFVLTRALEEWAASQAAVPLTIAVNLSPRNLHDPELARRVGQMLDAAGMATSSLALEITENVLLSDPVQSLDCLSALHDMGVRLAIDDFGTGYSSLSYLRRLPVDVLKIDKSFVFALAAGEDDVIVRSTIDLAHNLGLSVIAEGVEDEAVQRRLLALGCDAAQGYSVSGPGAAVDVRRWIDRQNSRPKL